ncbi:MAG: MarR family transcriptional regulator [Acidimicrobiaceae bacterium]|nr:MarR family transcriptional regulator [Acidimicrobiaceae bacterium]
MRTTTDAYRRLISEVYELAGRSRSTSERFCRPHGQSVARWHVLSVLLDEQRTVPQIADRLGLQRQSVQRIVNELLADGLVDVVDNPTHARSKLIAISPAGSRTAHLLFDESQSARQRVLSSTNVTATELEQARSVLERISRALADDEP